MSGLLERFLPSAGRNNEAHRESWLGQALARIDPGSHILDAGAGTQRYRKLCSHLQYTSQDAAQYVGTSGGPGLHSAMEMRGLDIVSDICAIPKPDGVFDAIMCVEVLEHLPEPVAALREFARLLRTGGELIL